MVLLDYWPVITGLLASAAAYARLEYKTARSADKDVVNATFTALNGRFDRLEKGVDKLSDRQEDLIDYLLRKNGDLP